MHDMPLICMNKGVGTRIGESLGDLEDIDVAGDGIGWGRCLRLRVNIHKPLESGRALNLGRKTYWVTFKYEKLLLFCYNCGRILHGGCGCDKRSSQRRHEEDGVKPRGVSLQVEDLRRKFSGGVGGRDSLDGGWDCDGGARQKGGFQKERSENQG